VVLHCDESFLSDEVNKLVPACFEDGDFEWRADGAAMFFVLEHIVKIDYAGANLDRIQNAE
jgi:hypothetical protein